MELGFSRTVLRKISHCAARRGLLLGADRHIIRWKDERISLPTPSQKAKVKNDMTDYFKIIVAALGAKT